MDDSGKPTTAAMPVLFYVHAIVLGFRMFISLKTGMNTPSTRR